MTLLKSQNSYLSLFSQKWLIVVIQVSKPDVQVVFLHLNKVFSSSVLVLYNVTGLWIASYHICSVFQLCPNNTVNSSESSISRNTPAENDEESVLRCVGVQ